MEKLFGPVDGHYAAVFVRELGGKFRVSYKVCVVPPQDYASAQPVRHKRVDGLCDSAAQAFEIAEQLARLHIASLGQRWLAREPDSYPATVPAGFDGLLDDDVPAPRRMYAATEPCPLYPAAAE